MRSSLVALTLLLSALALGAEETPALRTVFKDHFLIGAALNPSQFEESNPTEAAIVKAQFNAISPENVLKWEPIHPRPGEFNFGPADRYVQFGERNGMFIVGHTLVWHSQTPGWVFRDHDGPATREVLLQRMREHIQAVVGHFRGRVKGWDVVNEALADDGSLRQSPWRQIIGDDFILKAFEYAHEADPQAELNYNDYGLEDPAKRAGAVALVKKIKAAGLRIDAVGLQEHVNLTWPTTRELGDTLTAFAELGVKTMVTELDVDVLPARAIPQSADVSLRLAADPKLNPYTNGLPASVSEQLAQRYADLFAVYLKHTGTLTRVTFWGVTDGDSWLNNWPIPGRTAYPLLFDRQGQPKECYRRVIESVHN
jgi:endo-1,4-beta-xylanase